VRLLAARSGGHQARVVRCESLTRQRPLTCEEQAELVERAATLAPVFA
jgi:hypothetical protein